MTIRRSALDALRIVNRRANLLQAGNLLDAMTLDKFAIIRDAYLQRRRTRSPVPDGLVPDAEETSGRSPLPSAPLQAKPRRCGPSALRARPHWPPPRVVAWRVLHGVTGFLAMVAIGMALPLHVVATWRHHRHHVLGATALALLAALALSALKSCPRRSSA